MLVKLLQRAGEPGWWQRYDKRLMPESFDRLVGLQEAAATIRTFEIQYVPGLLQTGRQHPCRGGARPAQRTGERGSQRRRRTRACAGPSWLHAQTAPRNCGRSSIESVLLRVLGSPRSCGEQSPHLLGWREAPRHAADRPVGVTNASAPAHPGLTRSALRRPRPARRGVPGAHPERQLPRGPRRDRGVPDRAATGRSPTRRVPAPVTSLHLLTTPPMRDARYPEPPSGSSPGARNAVPGAGPAPVARPTTGNGLMGRPPRSVADASAAHVPPKTSQRCPAATRRTSDTTPGSRRRGTTSGPDARSRDLYRGPRFRISGPVAVRGRRPALNRTRPQCLLRVARLR
ncbi:hypothetical protein SHIRM173S_08795 [Streptomyces hirsutus]